MGHSQFNEGNYFSHSRPCVDKFRSSFSAPFARVLRPCSGNSVALPTPNDSNGLAPSPATSLSRLYFPTQIFKPLVAFASNKVVLLVRSSAERRHCALDRTSLGLLKRHLPHTPGFISPSHHCNTSPAASPTHPASACLLLSALPSSSPPSLPSAPRSHPAHSSLHVRYQRAHIDTSLLLSNSPIRPRVYPPPCRGRVAPVGSRLPPLRSRTSGNPLDLQPARARTAFRSI